MTDQLRKNREREDRRMLKQKLLKEMEKRFQTTIIGALAAFEAQFAELLGLHKKESELTSEQLEWRELWLEAREDILDNGNKQCRLAVNKLSEYDFEKPRFYADFIVRR